jgi:DNA-nicking Smr family endonuclease
MPEVKRPAEEIKAFPLVTNRARGVAWGPMDEPIQLPIDGVLDLHTFKPREIKDLVPDYLAACRERGIFQVRIIHGKGIGNLKRTVHSILARHPEVVSFALDHPQYGGWGATLVCLRKPPAQP